MNFERGLTPKEAIGIGQVAIALEIDTFYILDPSNMTEDSNGKLSPRRTELSESATMKALMNIRDGQPERQLRFYAFFDKSGIYHRLSEQKGLYVKYRDITYKIPS
jgi:hypothetical protein